MPSIVIAKFTIIRGRCIRLILFSRQVYSPRRVHCKRRLQPLPPGKAPRSEEKKGCPRNTRKLRVEFIVPPLTSHLSPLTSHLSPLTPGREHHSGGKGWSLRLPAPPDSCSGGARLGNPTALAESAGISVSNGPMPRRYRLWMLGGSTPKPSVARRV